MTCAACSVFQDFIDEDVVAPPEDATAFEEYMAENGLIQTQPDKKDKDIPTAADIIRSDLDHFLRFAAGMLCLSSQEPEELTKATGDDAKSVATDSEKREGAPNGSSNVDANGNTSNDVKQTNGTRGAVAPATSEPKATTNADGSSATKAKESAPQGDVDAASNVGTTADSQNTTGSSAEDPSLVSTGATAPKKSNLLKPKYSQKMDPSQPQDDNRDDGAPKNPIDDAAEKTKKNKFKLFRKK